MIWGCESVFQFWLFPGLPSLSATFWLGVADNRNLKAAREIGMKTIRTYSIASQAGNLLPQASHNPAIIIFCRCAHWRVTKSNRATSSYAWDPAFQQAEHPAVNSQVITTGRPLPFLVCLDSCLGTIGETEALSTCTGQKGRLMRAAKKCVHIIRITQTWSTYSSLR